MGNKSSTPGETDKLTTESDESKPDESVVDTVSQPGTGQVQGQGQGQGQSQGLSSWFGSWFGKKTVQPETTVGGNKGKKGSSSKKKNKNKRRTKKQKSVSK